MTTHIVYMIHDTTCHVISPQLTVQCHSQKKAPWRMARGSAVTDQMMTYCVTECVTDDSYSLYRYTMTEDKWEELLLCPCSDPGLVVIDSVLTAVGGYDGYSLTNKLVTLRQSRWVEEYPPMNTARSHPAVVSTSDGGHMNVIAIGGHGVGVAWIDAVELFHAGRRSWSRLTSLPQPLALPSATICGNQLHVIGYSGDGYSCSLQALLSSNQPIGSQSHTSTWTPLPRLPVTFSTAATLCGQLVIIGGMRGERDGSPVNSIHQLVDGQWVNIGSMSSCRWLCLVASPSPDKMVVVGGRGALDSVEVCVAV